MMTRYEKRLEQDLAQARATIQAQMAEAGRLDEVIDALSVERDQLNAANAMLAADLGAAERERDSAVSLYAASMSAGVLAQAIDENLRYEADIARLQAALAEARALLLFAGPHIGAPTDWPGRRFGWLEENHD